MNSSKHRDQLILRVAIPTPLRRLFDYLPPLDSSSLPGAEQSGSTAGKPDYPIGARIRVPFGRRQLVGVIVEVAENTDIPAEKLKPALQLLDRESVFPAPLLSTLLWAASYYQHPVGEVLATALPVLLRQGDPMLEAVELWSATTESEGERQEAEQLKRAPRQAALLSFIHSRGAVSVEDLKDHGFDSALLKQLHAKGLVERRVKTQDESANPSTAFAETELTELNSHALNANQLEALSAIQANKGFHCLLLDGVTGSGKTEVYMRAMEQTLKAGKQCLLLVPEIGLTPQAVARITQRFSCPIVLLHSGLTNRERLLAWRDARQGKAGIVIGTRSAVFTPLARPGLIVIDEEHDSSFKQQDGFRYSARDFAIKRAQQEQLPVVLGTATPSLESLNNALESRYKHIRLPERAGTAEPATMQIMDIENSSLDHGFSEAMLVKMEKHLSTGNQVLVFINRRGYAPVLQCQSCGWIAECENCIAQFTVHSRPTGLRCHHCGSSRGLPRQCPQCFSTHLETLGLGTQKLELFLERKFSGTPVLRIDRDSMRAKSSFDDMIRTVETGKPCILVGTQMLAKGHHFTDVTLVAVLDADIGLFSADFRGQEHMAQTIVQVAGRAGRGDKRGEVAIQSRHGSHPMLQNLVSLSYEDFAAQLLQERKQGQMPPFSHLALLQVEATQSASAAKFAEQILRHAETLQGSGNAQYPGVQILGPMPAPMEKRAGRFRWHLLFKSQNRAVLQGFLSQLGQTVESLRPPTTTRWNLDIDPIELI